MMEHLDSKAGFSRRRVLKYGLGSATALAAFGLGARLVLAQGVPELRIATGAADDWSPLRGGGNVFRWNSIWGASPMYFTPEGEIKPYVFASWASNADATEWMFEIAPNAVFSDGSPVTAADVKGSWELNAMPLTKNQRVAQVLSTVAGYDAITAGTATELPGVVATGERSLAVTLSLPDPIFFQKLANHIAPIVKVERVRGPDGNEVLEWWRPENGPVVSGPFRPESIDLDKGEAVFVPNENFFISAPKLAAIRFQVVDDPVAATAMLKSGQLQMHGELSGPEIVRELGAEFLSGAAIPTGQHFWFHVNRAPTDDINVRKALIMAIDRSKMLEVAWPAGPHTGADQILNAVSGVDPDFEPFPFDPEGARAALAASSYGSAVALPKIQMVGISNPATAVTAQYIVEQWRQNLGIEAVDMKPQIDQYAGPDQNTVQVFRDDVGTRVPDAISYLSGSILSSSGNAIGKLGGYKNDEVDRLLIEGAQLSVDDPQRDANAREAQRLFREDWAFIPWYHVVQSKWAMPQVNGAAKNLDWQIAEPWNLSIQ
jgi:peptide/nickel transport system substrate-binding protein